MARSEELTFRAGEIELAGTMTLPGDPPPADRNGRYPNVLLLPGWLPRDRDGAYDRAAHPSWFGHGPMGIAEGRLLARLAEALASDGVASLRYDKRGCGASGDSWTDADLFTLIDDARDALGAMRSRRDLDLRRTGIVGHGEGATLALSVAIADPAVGALTLIGASARSGRDVLRRGVAERTRRGVDRDHPLVAGLDRFAEELIERAARREERMTLSLPGGELVPLSLAYWEQWFHTPAIALATMLHRSVTLVHGEADVFSDPSESRLLAAALEGGGNRPRLVELAGIGHHLAEADAATVRSLAADLVARLQPRELPPVLLAIEEMG
ncbi:MAG TPA: alpha/beta hydrolase [Candidatus Limnocylindria bacterium]|nr:alpha/beta hydrolase [Candidatus Limnocylindria bacterium]